MKFTAKKIITFLLLFFFIATGFVDALMNHAGSYSSIMGLDINRVYFYTFLLLVTGCWLLYHHWIVGVGFLALASFNSYFVEYHFLHNYVASVLIYIGIVIDIVSRRACKWLIPLIILGVVQGFVFQTRWVSFYLVGTMEFLALCTGSAFVLKTMK